MTIYPRGNVYYVEEMIDGVRVKRSTGVKLQEGRKKAERVALDILRNLKPPTEKGQVRGITLSEAIDKTYELKWRHNKDEKTVLGRSKILKELLGANTSLTSIIKDESLEKLQLDLFARGITKATYNRYMSTLGVILSTCKIPYKVPKFQEEDGRIRYLTEEEESKMLEYLSSRNLHTYADFFVSLLDTGMRFSEMNDLEAREVNLLHKQIHLWVTKGNSPRTIPMTPRVYQILKERLSGGTTKVWGLNYDETYRVFQAVKSYLGLQEDEDFCIHALRHTCASRLVQRGVSLYVVQKILGHSSIQVTEKYAHLNTKALQEAMLVLAPKHHQRG